MKRSLLNTGGFVLAVLLALGLADVVGVLPAEPQPILCPEGSVAVWGKVRHELLDREFPNLSCRDDRGQPHGLNLNWADGHLLGLSFWEHGERVGASVTFHPNGRTWVVRDESAGHPYTVSWSEGGLKEYEEVQDEDLSHWTLWHESGTLKAQGTWAGESDPYWLPDGSFNEDRKDHSYLVGEYRSYHANGRPKNIGSYRDGARDGEWTCSDESGEHTVLATYSDGELISRTGDVDAKQMEDRCREYSPCARRDQRVEPVAENALDSKRERCSARAS